MRCLTKPGVVERVAERVRARRLGVPLLGRRAERGRQAVHELTRHLAGEEHHADRADLQVLDRALEVVADAVVDVDEVVVRGREVRRACTSRSSSARRADEQRSGLVPELTAAGRGIDDEQHAEPEVA